VTCTGELHVLPAGDSWVVGDEPYLSLDIVPSENSTTAG
jgi:hypothetical protein